MIDRNHRICYSSKWVQELPEETIRQAQQGAVLLEPNTRLRCAALREGYILWLEDVSAINAMLKWNRKIQDRLSEKHALLQAELALKQRKARLEVQNQLYDRLTENVKSQLQTIQVLLDTPPGDHVQERYKLGLICVVGAYIKRRSNLTLLGEEAKILPIEELELCIRESIDSVRVCGVPCSFQSNAEGCFTAELLEHVYDFFEVVIESALPTLSALFVFLTAQAGKLCLKINCEDSMALPPEAWGKEWQKEHGGSLMMYTEGRTSYLTLNFAERETTA